MTDILATICARTRHDVALRQQRTAAGVPSSSPLRGFAAALSAQVEQNGTAFICEIKRKSPSGGEIRPDLDVADIARAYAQGGAACLSILTDGPFFGGNHQDMLAARAVVDLPILCKDFMLTPYQIEEARAHGADCILLIMAALDTPAATGLAEHALNLGMDVLLEIHNSQEMQQAVAVPHTLLGINNRNLKTLVTDLATAETLASQAQPNAVLVGESGIRTVADVSRLRQAGINRFLVGESLLKQPDVTQALRALRGAG